MKNVWITGADRGIGQALVQCFLEDGWRVFAGRYLDYWHELEELSNRFGDRLFVLPLDVSDNGSVLEAARRTALLLPEGERLDMLVNVAGVTGRAEDLDNLLLTVGTNAVGPLRMAEAFLPMMGEGGRLCFFSSEAGSVDFQFRAGYFTRYCVSKTMLNRMAAEYFRRWRDRGLAVRLFHPGWVRSYMAGDEKAKEGNYEPVEAARAAKAFFEGEVPSEDVLFVMDILGRIWPF